MRGHTSCLALLVAAPAICASTPLADSVSVAEFSVEGVLSRIQTYADVCTERVPSLGANFSQLMRSLTIRVHEIAKPLLAPYANDPIVQGPTPKALVDTYNRWNQDLRLQLAEIDAPKQCPIYLANYGKTSDEFWRNGLQHTVEQLRQGVMDLGQR
jgi:hypothetical protein